MEKLEQERHTRTGRTLAILYGLYVMNFGESSDPRVLVELAQEAEQSGWNGFFLTDALMYHADGHEPATDTFVGLAAIASRTSRIRIGSAIAVLPRRLPWQVAREAAAIDQLSNGRLILGVGIGGETEVEYGRFGQKITPTVLGERLDESLDIITGLWSGEAFSYHGKHYQIESARFSPTPVQRPRVPIWIGGSWPNKPPFRRAARWDGLIPIKHEKTINVEPNDLLEIKAFVAKYRRNTGPLDIAIVGNASSKEQIESRRLEYERQGLITWWLKYLPAYRNSIKEMHEQIKEGPPGVITSAVSAKGSEFRSEGVA